VFIAKGNTNAAKKELNAILTKAADAMIKQEIERRIKDLDARLAAAVAVPAVTEAAAPAAAKAVTAPKEASKAPEAAEPIVPAKPVKQKKGKVSR